MDFQKKLNLFYKRYRDPQSGFFLESNTNRIFEEAKRDSYLHSVTRKDIVRFKNSLSTLSKNKERRILRGRKRVCSYRKWISWGPKNILLGDLCFIPNPRDPNGKKYTLLVLLDAFRYSLHYNISVFQYFSISFSQYSQYFFSRLCFVSILRNATSKETADQLEKAFDFFGGPPLKFSSDRGEIPSPTTESHHQIPPPNLTLAFFFSSGSEFGKDFRNKLRNNGIHQYFVYSGVWPKISLVENCILNLKRIFFRCLLEFSTLKFESVTQISQNVYNNRSVPFHIVSYRIVLYRIVIHFFLFFFNQTPLLVSWTYSI